MWQTTLRSLHSVHVKIKGFPPSLVCRVELVDGVLVDAIVFQADGPVIFTREVVVLPSGIHGIMFEA